jgi:hypothetical protein
VRNSIFRRLASLFFVLAFVASAQAYAMPMMGPAKAGVSMAGMMQGSPAGTCKDCSQDSVPTKADCTVMCAAVVALAIPVPTEQSIEHAIARGWASDALSSRTVAPDTSPPRA